MSKGTEKQGNSADPARQISWKEQLAWACLAALGFHAAHILGLGWLLIPCAYGLIELSYAPTNRRVFYPMLGLGLLFYAPQLGFFWNIFSAAAIALWLVLAFWLALFALSLRLVRLRWGNWVMLCLAPALWTGFEYFRSELYYLRFSWLTFGMANTKSIFHGLAGMYAFGFGVFVVASLLQVLRLASIAWQKATNPFATVIRRLALVGPIRFLALLLLGLAMMELLMPSAGSRKVSGLKVAGIQLEFPSDPEVLAGLERARQQFPEAELFMLSEYTFQEPVPAAVRDWCAVHHKYLVVGGKEPVDDTRFYNMAYVIGPEGSTVHQQVKSVPIQFFQDGLPAPQRTVWNSPWGRLGVLTCYDLSYTRIVDDFVRQGAIALLNPTMDVIDWGEQQHELHSRVAPVRSAEYCLPVFRVASSGVSQITDASGNVQVSAPFPGEGEIIGGELPLPEESPRVPVMNRVASACSVGAFATLAVASIPPRKTRSRSPESAP